MANEIEYLDSPNEEVDLEPQPEEPTEDVAALKKRNEELSGKNRQLFERAKKAEGFEKNAEGHWGKIQKPEVKSEPKAEMPPQSNEPDYAKLAFLNSQGVTYPDDQKVVTDEAARLKLPLTDVLQMDHIKSKLKDSKDQREAESGAPKGNRKGGKGANELDYYLEKDQVPEALEMVEKFFEAKDKRERKTNMFDPIH